MGKIATIGIAEMGIVKGDDSLITYALGSCIGVCLYDATTKIAGMVHVMLPTIPEGTEQKNLCRYADSGVVALVEGMERVGVRRRNLVAKIAGGAKMFDIPGDSSLGNIGERNIASVKKALQALSIKVAGEDVGSNYARTMSFNASDGMVTIKAFAKGTSTW